MDVCQCVYGCVYFPASWKPHFSLNEICAIIVMPVGQFRLTTEDWGEE